MKQIRVIIILFLAMSCDKPSIETEPEYHIILVMGQSNALAGRWIDPAIDSVSDGIMQLGRFYGKDLEIIEAIEPLHHHKTRDSKRIGFALTFAKKLNNHWQRNKDILIIPAAHGGTGFGTHYWNKGDTLYEDAVLRTRYVLATYPNSKLTAILWHQGEDDVGKPDFQQNLDSFIVNIRHDIGCDTVPFILGGMVPSWVYEDELRLIAQDMLKNTPKRLEFVGYADPIIPFIIKNDNFPDEPIHYDAEGQRELGRRYFQEFLRLTE